MLEKKRVDSVASSIGASSTLTARSNGSVTSSSSKKTPKSPEEIEQMKKLKKLENDKKVLVKIADLGNACWINKHFTKDIQTRQYRSPEVIIGADYDTSTDMWSLGCIVFELLTGDYLFDPKPSNKYTKDDDHVAQIIELLGNFPRNYALSGEWSNDLFNKRGALKNISNLRFWSLENVLMEKYRYPKAEAKEIAEFILPMIEIVPNRRATAQQMLKNPWIKNVEIDISEFENPVHIHKGFSSKSEKK